eukprot:jgi/Chrpa1/24680/Chrysochromulina_OHIO_Genome00008147-RA
MYPTPQVMNSAFDSSPLSFSSTASIAGGMRVLQKPHMRLRPAYALRGMMPGKTGTVIPAARISPIQCLNTSKS